MGNEQRSNNETGTVLTPETIETLRVAFDFSKRQVLASLGKTHTPDVARDIYDRAKNDLDATASGLLNALATGTEQDYISKIQTGTVSAETLTLFCRLCLENATDIIGKIRSKE